MGRNIFYPDGTSVTQERGSLMGSPLSFPLLCLVNAFTLHMAGVKRYLVNGDDGLCFMSKSQLDCWRTISQRLGLKVNEAKTYWSFNLVTINSRYFRYTNGRFTEIPIVQPGLFLSEVSGTNYDLIPDPWKWVYKRYCKFHNHEHRPLGIPLCLGGLGGTIPGIRFDTMLPARDYRAACRHWMRMKRSPHLWRSIHSVRCEKIDPIASREYTWLNPLKGFLGPKWPRRLCAPRHSVKGDRWIQIWNGMTPRSYEVGF